MSNKTRIVVLLDRSGSMDIRRSETLAGLNTFLNSQRNSGADATLKLVQFDSWYETDDKYTGKYEARYATTYDGPVRYLPTLNLDSFVPRGGTPLLDAQGKLIDELGEELRNLPESARPDKVIFVTITDGEENSSNKFTAAKIKSKISHQTDKYNWDFVYLGANQDAIAVGTNIGVMSAKTMTYSDASAASIGATYSNLSNYVTRGVQAQSLNAFKSNSWTEQERNSSLSGEDNSLSATGGDASLTNAVPNTTAGTKTGS